IPRSQGGLSLLNPALEINVFQWCWLNPLLHPSDPTPVTKTSLPFIRVVINYSLTTPAYPTAHITGHSSSLLAARPAPTLLQPP
ncbi:hypothetical protein MBANPS3_006027, partial [Mucor bainieri]